MNPRLNSSVPGYNTNMPFIRVRIDRTSRRHRRKWDEGAGGERYQIETDGYIDESTYAVTTKGVYFPFSPRHTLPTGVIVPFGAIPTCYQCHRLDRTVPPQNPKVPVPVNFPAASAQETDLDLVQLTDDGGQLLFESASSGNMDIWTVSEQRKRGQRTHYKKFNIKPPKQLVHLEDTPPISRKL